MSTTGMGMAAVLKSALGAPSWQSVIVMGLSFAIFFAPRKRQSLLVGWWTWFKDGGSKKVSMPIKHAISHLKHGGATFVSKQAVSHVQTKYLLLWLMKAASKIPDFLLCGVWLLRWKRKRLRPVMVSVEISSKNATLTADLQSLQLSFVRM
jgi:hypothetical protein